MLSLLAFASDEDKQFVSRRFVVAEYAAMGVNIKIAILQSIFSCTDGCRRCGLYRESEREYGVPDA